MTAMEEFTAPDGCPAWRADMLFDDAQRGWTFHWGVVVDAPQQNNVWGIPTETGDPNARAQHRSFALRGDGQVERYWLTHCRRFGANKLWREGADKPALTFSVWAPNAREVDAVIGEPVSGYIWSDGRGVKHAFEQIIVVLGAHGLRDAADGEVAAAQSDRLADAQAEAAGDRGAGDELVAGRRPPAVHRHHFLSSNSSLERTPRSSAWPPRTFTAPSSSGETMAMFLRFSMVPMREVRFAQVSRLQPHAAERDAAVAQREVVGLRRHDDVGAVGLELVLGLHRERAAQREQRHHGGDPISRPATRNAARDGRRRRLPKATLRSLIESGSARTGPESRRLEAGSLEVLDAGL